MSPRSVVGLSSKRFSSPLGENMNPAGGLRSTGITPLRRYYSPLRLPAGPGRGYGFPPPVGPTPCLDVRPLDRVSQVPRLIFRRPPSPTTPESPTAVSARCLAAGVRLHLIWEDGHSHLRIEAETGSRSRITADAFAFPGFDGVVAQRPRRVGFMGNEQLPWSVPFN